jgi:hypothetical protein
MKRIISIVFLTLIFGIGAYGQSNDCPANLPATVVCVNKDAFTRLLRSDDENASLKAQLVAKDKQIESRNTLITTLTNEKVDFQVKWALAVGENTELRASRVRDQAVMDILIKQARPKQNGFINVKF